MLIAVNEAGIYMQADHAKEGPFRCPVCLQPVILKKGRYKIAHFSHQRLIDCHKSAYKAESPAHLAGKHLLYDMARRYRVAMECYLSDIEQIPDILVEDRLAVELQLSVIPVDAIIRRSAGYRKLGIDVIWIADDLSLRREDGALRLSAFQRSLVETKRMQLYSFDSEAEMFYVYQLTDVTAALTLRYTRRRVQSIDDMLETSIREMSASLMSGRDKLAFIRQCLRKKDVREPTLSALYQLGIHHQALPDHLGIVVPNQFYIRTHPVTWQSQLLLELKSDTFDAARFSAHLEFYGLSGPCHEAALTRQLLRQYSDAYKKLCVQY